MPMGKRLCVNMIVKNEASIIRRCLASIAPWIDGWVIGDTGSSDNTPDLIGAFFANSNIPGELHRFQFEDFEQARNQALDLCRKSKLEFDYVMLLDADMELVVADDQFRAKLTAPAYLVTQTANISYRNTRLVRRDVDCRYRGLTHEFLDITGPGAVPLDGLHFLDHANGSSRSEKVERDCRLLQRALEQDPNDARAMFYLANTLRDAGHHAQAIQWYERRIAAGGFAEEVWYSSLRIADCRRAMGDVPAFIQQALLTYQQRPSRAEPLHRLANHYRNAHQHEIAMLFAEAGSQVPYPSQDRLFVEDGIYRDGFREEMSIAGYYCSSESRRAMARECGFALATSLTASANVRRSSRSNTAFWAQPLSSMIPGVTFEEIRFNPQPMNPSVCMHNQKLFAVLRTVNYKIEPSGSYTIVDGGKIIRTNNYFSEVTPVIVATLMSDLTSTPKTGFAVEGFEDCRLFRWRNGWWCSATVRDRTPGGMCEIALLEIDANMQVIALYIQPGPARDRHEKNWVPFVDGDTLYFVYSTFPTIILRCDDPREGSRKISESLPTWHLDHLRGSSQAVRIDSGWLYVAHECIARSGRERLYLHRFVLLNTGLAVAGITPPFRWRHNGIEFCAGLTRDSQTRQLIASFGIHDSAAWIARFSEVDIIAAIEYCKS